jgi:hypothetical protein
MRFSFRMLIEGIVVVAFGVTVRAFIQGAAGAVVIGAYIGGVMIFGALRGRRSSRLTITHLRA